MVLQYAMDETAVRIGSAPLEKDGKRNNKSRFFSNRTKRSDADMPDSGEIRRCASIGCNETETESLMIYCDFCEKWFHGS